MGAKPRVSATSDPAAQLSTAVQRLDPEGVALALANGADPNAREAKHGHSLLMRVPSIADDYRGNGKKDKAANAVAVADALIGAGADINATDKNGNTPLHWTLRTFNGSDIKLTRLYLERGANVDTPDGKGVTVLHMVATRGALSFAKLFVDEFKADVNARWKTTSAGRSRERTALFSATGKMAAYLKSRGGIE